MARVAAALHRLDDLERGADLRRLGDDTEAPGLEVLEGGDELLPGVHDEGAVGGDGLTDRPTAEQDDLEGGAARVLAVVRRELERTAS